MKASVDQDETATRRLDQQHVHERPATQGHHSEVPAIQVMNDKPRHKHSPPDRTPTKVTMLRTNVNRPYPSTSVVPGMSANARIA